jgi:hypothetical protein
MKFGKLLEQSARPDWAVNYVNYKVVPKVAFATEPNRKNANYSV